HATSRRSKGPFVAINCGAIPENLLESELFGHVKGAFTGAVENRIGAAKAADGGTLFLDEICEMDLKLQVKLLRFLQTEMIQRVGSSAAEPVDVRIICATNRDPELEVSAGRFREDLFYRLNVIPISLPPLRERGDDVVLIAKELAKRIAKEEGREMMGFTAQSEAFLSQHPWPGNVRELQNSLRRAIVTASGTKIELTSSARQSPQRPVAVAYEPLTSGGIVPPAGAENWTPTVSSPPASADFAGMTLEQVERMAIEQAISQSAGNICEAARQLDVSPSTIYRKLERWGAA
ncbi:MAG: sigma-54 dependent transcriptional regulator, partial [Marinomonas sp.]